MGVWGWVGITVGAALIMAGVGVVIAGKVADARWEACRWERLKAQTLREIDGEIEIDVGEETDGVGGP